MEGFSGACQLISTVGVLTNRTRTSRGGEGAIGERENNDDNFFYALLLSLILVDIISPANRVDIVLSSEKSLG